ncbi:Peptide chain release factor 1 [Streptomyces griseoloalbus]
MFEAVEELVAERADLEKKLADPSVHSDQANARKLNKRYAELTPIVATYRSWKQTGDDVETRAVELAADVNLTGHPAPENCDAAQEMLGDSVSVYLDGGPTPGNVPSSIVDVTRPVPLLLREGAISPDELRKVVPDLEVAN